MTNNPQRQHQHENEPSLSNPVPLNVWREVYNGRWKMLRGIQKAEFIVELAFLVFFCAFAIYAGSQSEHRRNGAALVRCDWHPAVVLLRYDAIYPMICGHSGR